VKPDYWDRAKRALAKRDPVMAAIMRAHPKVFMMPRGEPFFTLARAIVGQQISVKAAQTVWNRVLIAADGRPGRLAAPVVIALDPAALRGCGLSQRKTEYIRDLATRFVDGHIRPRRWQAMDDEAVIAELVAVKGIGRWTAEMFLMFNLGRPDVLPVDDLGVRNAARRLYRMRKMPDATKAARSRCKRW
jgi:DNA-3-methyladenine glycosylase II